MPRVVAYQPNQIAPAQPVQARLRPANNNGGALGGFAQGLQDTGRTLDVVAQQNAQNEDTLNEASVRVLDNSFADHVRQALYTGDDALFTKQGFDAGTARPQVEKGLQDYQAQLLSSVKNDAQRRMLAPLLDNRLSTARESISQYVIGQTRDEDNRQSVARTTGFQQDAVLSADDPAKFGEQVDAGVAEINARAQKQGWSADRTAIEVEQFRSDTNAAVVQSRLARGDIDGANKWLTDHRGQINWKTQMQLDAALKDPLQRRQASGDADTIMGTFTPQGAQTTPSTNNFDAIVHIESRGRQLDDKGEPLTSPKGAIGIAQIMPSTGPEAAKLAGVAWDPVRFRTDAAYNAQLGQAYFDMLCRKYGNPVMAAAAYNCGPGRMDQAIAAGGSDWLSHVPPETKKYVAKFQASSSATATQAPQQLDLNQLLAQVDATAKREGWSFERTEAAKTEIERRVSLNSRLLSQQQAQAYDRALTKADSLGASFTDVSQLGPDFQQMAPEQQHTLIERAKANVKGEAPKANGDTYLSLHLMAAYDPDRFAQIDLRGFRQSVTPAEFDSLAQDQAKMRRAPTNGYLANDRAKIDTAIRLYGADVGIGNIGAIDSKTGQRKNAEQYLKIVNTMQAYLARATDNGNRQPTDDDFKRAFDDATMQVVLHNSGWFGGDKMVRRYDLTAGESIGVPVPKDIAARIVTAYQQAGRGVPPPDEIGRIYLRNKGRPGFWD